ncbi:MAG: ABC transporter substrate-binding protein [Lautropia sp.]
MATFVSVSDGALFLAFEKGFFKSQNIDVQFKSIPNSTMAITSLASGDVDVSGGSAGGGVANAVRQGIQIRLVADKGSAGPGHGYLAFVSRPDVADKIKVAADLRGRVVGVAGYFSGVASEVTVSHMLRDAGMKESEINFINLNFSDIVAGMGTGKIDVGLLVEPLATQMVAKGTGVIWKRVDEVYPNQQYTAVFYGPGIIKRPDVAERFMQAYIQGARFYNDALKTKQGKDWEELVTVLAKYTTVKDRALYEKMTFPGINPDGYLNLKGMQDDMKWFVESGRMKESIDIARMVDHSYIEKALAKLGANKAKSQ